MIHDMRRQDRALSDGQTEAVIKNGNYGVLSTIGKDGYPYGVPLHYALIDGNIYFHSTSGKSHKADNFANSDKVSFTVLEMEDAIKGRSAVIFGRIKKVADLKAEVISAFVEKFVPEFAWDQAKSGIPFALPSLEAYTLVVDKVSGKWVGKPEGK